MTIFNDNQMIVATLSHDIIPVKSFPPSKIRIMS